MKSSSVRKRTSMAVIAAVLLVAVMGASAVAAPSSTGARSHPCVVAAGSGDQAFVRNFNPFNFGTQRDFTWGGIYENLLISTAVGGGRQYNILAKNFGWSKNGKTLTITVQPNVKWSDGKPLTAADVLYSLTIGRQDKAADRINLVGPASNIAAVKLAGKDKVAVQFKQVDSTFLGATLPNVPIVPRHVWTKVKDVTNFANPNPVGSGPFNRITSFSGQSYTLSKNPNYWRAGSPRIDCVKRIFTASNDAGLLQIVSGQADWTHNFVPNVESAYTAKDPKNYRNAYLTTNLAHSLTFNTTQYPYSIPAFRKGVSQAIDRKMVSKLGEYGYGPPTTALGIEPLYPNWIDPSLKAKAKLLATYDPAAARKTFTDAGFTYKGGDLVDPKGDKVKFQMHVIGGWSDWVASLQIVSRNLQSVGIDASVKIEPDWAAWISNSAVNGNAPSLIWSNGAGDPTPYAYFYSHFDPSQVVPTGQDALALGNFERHSDAAAAALLRQFKGTLDRKKQLQAAYKLEAIFLDQMPFIPLFTAPLWSTYSTKFVKGFITWQNQYANPIFSTQQQVEISLLSLYYADSKRKYAVPAIAPERST
jgi:peptide/nickel transport system substrate-binding protein